jgi:hypothetical protein
VKGNHLVSAVWVVLLMSLVGLLMGILPEVEWVQSVVKIMERPLLKLVSVVSLVWMVCLALAAVVLVVWLVWELCRWCGLTG